MAHSVTCTADLYRRLDRLDGLPLRPATVRALLGLERHGPANRFERDPGWQLELLIPGGRSRSALERIAERPWWRTPSPTVRNALRRLWEHGQAVGLIAAEWAPAGPARTELLALGLLHQLGLWAIAAVAPEQFADLLEVADPRARRQAERSLVGIDSASLGRELVARWGADPLLGEAAWLHADPTTDLADPRLDTNSLALIQRAFAWVERSPWSLAPQPADRTFTADPLSERIATVISQGAGDEFISADASPSEERLARKHARLKLKSDHDRQRSDERRADLVRRLDQVHEAHRDHPLVGSHQGERLAALGEFAAGAAHELNNPLAVILGRAQLLLGRADLGPESARSLRAIITQAQRAHRMLRDLIYIARPSVPRPRRCQPDEAIRACVRDLTAEAESRGVRFEVAIRDESSWTWADPDPIRHLAEVVIRNALEASPKGGVIRITSERNDDWLRWAIQDEGPGLTETEARHLLDPFFCGRQAGRGLGLGLPRAARFLEFLGGRLSWRIEPTRGTIFEVAIPLLAPPEGPVVESRSNEPGRAA